MDVELSDGDCFEIFRRTRVKAPVIMTTAYDSYAIKAFEAGSVDYLLKPLDSAAVRRAVGRCLERRSVVDAQKLLSMMEEKHKNWLEQSTVRCGDRIIPIYMKEIAYFFSDDKANFIMTNKAQKYIIDSTLDSIAKEVDPAQFFRISRGAIVSRVAVRTAVKALNGKLKVELEPEPPFGFTVSRSRAGDFLQWLEDGRK